MSRLKLEIRYSINAYMNINRHNTITGGAAGFVLYVALLTILTAGAVGGFFLWAAYNHSQLARRWHDADQCLLDAQSALEQVKYEMIQAYGSNGQSSVTWFLNWSSNAIGAAPSYNIPSPLTVNGTPVFMTLAGVTVSTNASTNLVTLTLVADARKSATWLFRRQIQEQMQMSITAGGSPISANCAFGMYGSNYTLTVNGSLTIDGGNWNLPSIFNSGNGSTNKLSTNDLPGVVYTSTKISTGSKISIDGTPPQTNAVGAYTRAYWNQFLNTIIPKATTYTGGSLGTRTGPLIKILPSGVTTLANATSGAGILIIPTNATITINQNFYYEGMIILVSDNSGDTDMTQNKTTTIYGTLICLGDQCGIKVSGTLNVLYSKQALTNLASIANLPSASSGSNGVPYTYYWREIH